MNEKEYYEKSSEKNLQNRCPILDRCSRRAETIYQFSEYYLDRRISDNDGFDVLIRMGELSKDFRKHQIEIQGELPYISPGRDHYYFSNVCPEVNLFDDGNALISKIACVEGSYDKFYALEKHKVLKCLHYSECPEFNHYEFHKKAKGQTKKRRTVPLKVKAVLQQEIRSQCPFCPSDEVGHFQVHHINEDSANNDLMNLLMVCPTCHSKITKGDIAREAVVAAKSNLQRK